jgi:hypothetical protein
MKCESDIYRHWLAFHNIEIADSCGYGERIFQWMKRVNLLIRTEGKPRFKDRRGREDLMLVDMQNRLDVLRRRREREGPEF